MTWAFSSNGGGFDHGIASRVNMLESFYYVQPWQTELIPYLKSFLLDSGGYTLRRGKGDVTDWDSYLTRYIDYINRNDVRLFFDLDIDGEVGYRGVLRFRERLERETGKRSIPVWHCRMGSRNGSICATSTDTSLWAVWPTQPEGGRWRSTSRGS